MEKQRKKKQKLAKVLYNITPDYSMLANVAISNSLLCITVPQPELAYVCIGKCSIYISKCHKIQPKQKIGECLD